MLRPWQYHHENRQAVVRSMSVTETDETKQLADTIVDIMSQAIAPLRDCLDVLEAKLEQHKAAGVVWAGTYEQGRGYTEGALTTRAGSLWLALANTTDTPGTSNAWRLVVKGNR